mmetsp:Transcript_11814/g.54971  ORF Transcript_11814/g.54971 Transcript_11814/m.54971 type:complete len:366 (-) Transcript_11814:820-1917(-)
MGTRTASEEGVPAKHEGLLGLGNFLLRDVGRRGCAAHTGAAPLDGGQPLGVLRLTARDVESQRLSLLIVALDLNLDPPLALALKLVLFCDVPTAAELRLERHELAVLVWTLQTELVRQDETPRGLLPGTDAVVRGVPVVNLERTLNLGGHHAAGELADVVHLTRKHVQRFFVLGEAVVLDVGAGELDASQGRGVVSDDGRVHPGAVGRAPEVVNLAGDEQVDEVGGVRVIRILLGRGGLLGHHARELARERAGARGGFGGARGGDGRGGARGSLGLLDVLVTAAAARRSHPFLSLLGEGRRGGHGALLHGRERDRRSLGGLHGVQLVDILGEVVLPVDLLDPHEEVVDVLAGRAGDDVVVADDGF